MGENSLPTFYLAYIIETSILVALLHLIVSFQDTPLTSMTHKVPRTVSDSNVK